ncbi:shikimate dehydrogenase [Candidatus Woesearchaeota archaeon]|nr:shikimate dehydrogenase [Candidatus Woesearchaeota archaeon]
MICCSIAARTKEHLLDEMSHIKFNASLVEVRMDSLMDAKPEDIKEIIAKKRKPVILACKGVEKKICLGLLKKGMEEGAEYIDLDLDYGEKTIKEFIKTKKDTKIIVSYHNNENVPENIQEIYEKIKKLKPDIIKIACTAVSLSDNIIILDLLKKSKADNIDMIAHCMGPKGQLSRILNVPFGSFLTYGYLNQPTAPGQISCDYLKKVYRVDRLKPGVNIYGLIGNPISASRSYIVHNLAFKEHELNAVYINVELKDLKELDLLKHLFSGLSVTMPFKESILTYLDHVDDRAAKIGAVNTVVIKQGKLFGYNTDWTAALDTIQEKIQIQDKNVVLIGAGGAAKAIAFGIWKKRGRLTIINRTEANGKKLASSLHVSLKKINEIDWEKVDLLINATPIGMAPRVHDSPVPRNVLRNMVVFDTIYNPLITKLLNDAERNRCPIVTGIKMFINQAAQQFEFWTRKKPDKELMEESVLQYVVDH